MKTISAEIVFGLVSIPVKYTNMVDPAGEKTGFKNLHAKCLTPVKNKVWCPTCNVEVETIDVVKGVKAGGSYVEVPVGELREDEPAATNMITLTKFVPVDQIVAEMYYKHYHLIPDKHPDRYALLTAGLVKRKMVGLGSVRLVPTKERPVIIRPYGDGLEMILANMLEDLVDAPYTPPPKITNKSMVGLAGDLIDDLAGTLEPGDLSTEARTRREALVAQILDDQPVAGLPSMDLMTMLKLSVGRKKVKA